VSLEKKGGGGGEMQGISKNGMPTFVGISISKMFHMFLPM